MVKALSQTSQSSWHRQALASQAKLRVLLDARKLGDGGIGTYIENLIGGFLELGVALTVIGPRSKLLRFGLIDHVGIINDETPSYSLSELFLLGRRINQRDFDIYHCPHFTLPRGIKIPSVITVHDLIHIRYPERFYYPMVAGHLIRSAVQRATRVLSVSHAARAELELYCGHDPLLRRKLSVVPNAVDPIFGMAPDIRHERPYFLAVVSNSKPHKGLKELVEGFQMFCASRSNALASIPRLVLAGEGARGLRDMHGAIAPLGPVSKERLVRLYQNASALVVPSRAEGFCLPVLEAHACGTPVVTTPVPAIREIVSDNDVICSGFSASDIAEGLSQFFSASIQRKEAARRSAGRWFEKYSRAEMARQVLEVYANAVSGGAAR